MYSQPWACVGLWLPHKYPLKQSCRTGVQTNPTKYFWSWPKPVFLNLISRTSFGLIKDKMSPNFLQWRPIPPQNFFFILDFFLQNFFPFVAIFYFWTNLPQKVPIFKNLPQKHASVKYHFILLCVSRQLRNFQFIVFWKWLEIHLYWRVLSRASEEIFSFISFGNHHLQNTMWHFKLPFSLEKIAFLFRKKCLFL